MLNFAHRYDLFSQPFSFMIGEQIKKSTTFGGFLSLSIISVSLAYLSYLLYNFFSYKIYPNVSNSIKINDKVEMDLDYNFHMFQVLINGIPIEQYEAQQNKKYVTYRLIYEQYTDTEQIQKDIRYNDCNQPGFKYFNCISSEEKTNTSYMISSTREQGFYTLLLGKCVNEVGVQDNCASEEEIDKLFTDINNFFQLYVQIKQYNTLERQFEMGFKQEYFFVATSQVTYTTITLKKALSQVSDGLIIQQSEQVESIFDYARFDSIYTTDGYTMYDKPGFKMLVGVSFLIDQISNNIIIQHVQLTQILAQFMSVFNSLLVIGIFARLIASKNIQQDFMAILFADSYKQQAFDVIEYSQLNHKNSTENILEQKSENLPKKKKKKEQSISTLNKEAQSITAKNEKIESERQIQPRKHQTSIIINRNEIPIEKRKHQTSVKISQNQTQIQKKPQSSILLNKHPISKYNKYNQTSISENQNQILTSLKQQSLQQDQPQISIETNRQSSPHQLKDEKYSTEYDNQNIFLKICNKEKLIQSNKLDISIKSILNIPITLKIKSLVCRIFCCMKKKKVNENKELKYIQEVFGKIEEEMRNTLNIYSIYQDLIRIKMAIKLLFTEDQYAALHFCTNTIINDTDSLKRDISQLNINQEIRQITKEKYNIKPDQFNTCSPRYQEQEDEVLSNQNLVRFKQNSVVINDKSMQSQFTKNYFDSQQTIYSKRFIDHYKNQISNTQNEENQEIQSKLNCAIVGDNEGNIQNESLDDEIMNKNIDSREAKDQRISQSKNNTFDFNNHPQIQQKKKLKSHFNTQNPFNQQINGFYNHLQVMELIDKDRQVREIYFNKFIQKHTWQKNNNILTITDTNIFNSLLK